MITEIHDFGDAGRRNIDEHRFERDEVAMDIRYRSELHRLTCFFAWPTTVNAPPDQDGLSNIIQQSAEMRLACEVFSADESNGLC